MRFLLEHLPNCSPLDPCASCKAVELLKRKLQPVDQSTIWGLVCEAYGKDPPALKEVQSSTIDLSTPWRDVLTDLSPRTARYLGDERLPEKLGKELRTLQDILDIPRSKFLGGRIFYNFGRVRLQELEGELAKHGLRLQE